jgi:hypothetical protein
MTKLRDPLSISAGAGGLRAADLDRDAVADALRAQHLAGRLDHDELELRLGRCLAARTYIELAALIADLPVERRAILASARPRFAAGRARTAAAVGTARRVARRLALLVALLMLTIWFLSTAALPFWPAWVWLGLAIPLGLDVAIGWAWHRPPGRARRAVVRWTLVGAVEGILVAIWALEWVNGGRPPYFWPVWPLLSALAVAACHWAVRDSHPADRSI